MPTMYRTHVNPNALIKPEIHIGEVIRFNGESVWEKGAPDFARPRYPDITWDMVQGSRRCQYHETWEAAKAYLMETISDKLEQITFERERTIKALTAVIKLENPKHEKE